MKTNYETNKEIFERGVEDIIERDHLRAALQSSKKLRVKFGIDPTAPDLHLGHAAVLRKLRQFQEAGHKIVFIIGDYTARIGDPSGVSKTRPELTATEVRANMKHYLSQASKILDLKKTEVLRNSVWLDKLRGGKILELLSLVSVNQILEREDFGRRVADHKSVRIHELLYPVLQGYDSVVVKADIEVGGRDQLFNLLLGRELMVKFGLNPQDILTVELLEGTDGVRKMSKSYGNYISLDAKPKDMYGKIMSVPDHLINKYFELLTDASSDEISKMDKNFSPFERKKKAAYAIVSALHSKHSASGAEKHFSETFSEKKIPENLEIRSAYKGQPWFEFLFMEKLVESKSQARQLIKSGGLDFNEKKVKNYYDKILESGVARIGKRRFIKIETEDKKKKV